jgi:hypothetical protein
MASDVFVHVVLRADTNAIKTTNYNFTLERLPTKNSQRDGGAMKVVFLVWISLSSSAHCLQIQVCQNKSCCKAWHHSTPLPEVLRDLLGPEVAIDATTACFSQCQNGPNICVKRKNEPDMMMHGIDDPTTAAAHLEAKAAIEIPSKLLAAVNVLEKAQQGTLSILFFLLQMRLHL